MARKNRLSEAEREKRYKENAATWSQQVQVAMDWLAAEPDRWLTHVPERERLIRDIDALYAGEIPWEKIVTRLDKALRALDEPLKPFGVRVKCMVSGRLHESATFWVSSIEAEQTGFSISEIVDEEVIHPLLERSGIPAALLPMCGFAIGGEGEGYVEIHYDS